MTSNPKVSVIMGIYNCEKTLAEAVDSIVNQTYANWELIMCDDGSTDGTYGIAEKYRQSYPDRIVLLKNKQNMKLAFTLNRCLEAATGELIARMDGDDRSWPERLQRQVSFLVANPDIHLVGTAMRLFNDEQGAFGVIHRWQRPDKSVLINDTPFFHPTVLTYKWVCDSLNGYCTEKRAERVEDIDLWFRFFSKGYAGANLHEALYDFREDYGAVRRRTLQARIHSIQTRAAGYRLLGFPVYWIIRPACVLFLKGLVPSPIASRLRQKRALRRKD